MALRFATGCAALALATDLAAAQQVGTVTAEQKPPITIQVCTKAEGCKTEDATVTLDANWRWVHNAGGYTSCKDGGGWKEEFCPDALACAKNCAVEGVDKSSYEDAYGIFAVPDGVRMQYVAKGGGVGSRSYVGDATGDKYRMFQLLNREFTFEVDVSTLECGINAALYFVEMDAGGDIGKGENAAGAKYGLGYCDAQCPGQPFMQGEANMNDYGACCAEMDLWEANKMATAVTAHPCKNDGFYKCEDEQCGRGEDGLWYVAPCDRDGCDYNPYRMGQHHYYGPGKKVDSKKPITVVTQFVTKDGTDDSPLHEIRRVYVQEGKVVHNAVTKIPFVKGDSLTDKWCAASKKVFNKTRHEGQPKGPFNAFRDVGGMAQMGAALKRGVTLVLSIWDDAATKMQWLDSKFPNRNVCGALRGPCSQESGDPAVLHVENKDAYVVYSKIAVGEIGSTVSGVKLPVPHHKKRAAEPIADAGKPIKPQVAVEISDAVAKSAVLAAPAAGGVALCALLALGLFAGAAAAHRRLARREQEASLVEDEASQQML